MTHIETMKQSLAALESDQLVDKLKAAQALRAAIAQGEPEPVAWIYECGTIGGYDYMLTKQRITEGSYADSAMWIETPLYTHPAPYVPLTDETVRDLAKESGLVWKWGNIPLFEGDPTNRFAVFAEAIERAVRGEK